MSDKQYKQLTEQQIEALSQNGCTAEDYNRVLVSDSFDPARVVSAHFSGDVLLGDNTGTIDANGNRQKPCGIYNAAIADCTIGDNVRIANVGVGIANYDIAENVCIENVGLIQTKAGATFGNGVEIEVLNEGGGREVTLFNELSVQFAHMLCLHRYRPTMIENLNAIAARYTESVTSDRGTIASGTRICSTDEIIDVNIGNSATINAAATLKNGTILSSPDAPTIVAAKASAKDFIIAEGSSLTGGAVIDKVFVGQGCQIGKQFSAENSLFFANSEAFHGEACSVFAGPYTVTHHKSTLLIAGLFSFYNAGSGTNQSNHMYKLGPVHEGKLLRGTKTGSFSYMMWPCIAGPFCVVLGKHTGTFDVSDFPFSHLEARSDGKCMMVPGLHLTTVGTVRDGAKWPNRDRRKGKVKRDILNFDVFSPYTVGKMIKARAQLKALQDTTEKSIEEVSLNGTLVRRLILRTSQKYYRTGIEMYLLGKLIEAVESKDLELGAALAPAEGSVCSDTWIDLGGQMMARDRLVALQDDLENGNIKTAADLTAKLNEINDAYTKDEWAWVSKACKDVFDIDPATATADDIARAADMYLRVRGKFFNLVIADAQKEFDAMSQSGFGADGTEDDVLADFTQVRGTYDDNKFVKEMKQSVEALNKQIAELKEKLAAL